MCGEQRGSLCALICVCEGCAVDEPLLFGLFVKWQIKWVNMCLTLVVVTHWFAVWAEHEVPANSRQLNKGIKTNVQQQPHVDGDH